MATSLYPPPLARHRLPVLFTYPPLPLQPLLLPFQPRLPQLPFLPHPPDAQHPPSSPLPPPAPPKPSLLLELLQPSLTHSASPASWRAVPAQTSRKGDPSRLQITQPGCIPRICHGPGPAGAETLQDRHRTETTKTAPALGEHLSSMSSGHLAGTWRARDGHSAGAWRA